MKIVDRHIIKTWFALLGLLCIQLNSVGQGRVVINEYMPWSGCNTTSEFIELLNFGPGPANIGCYIITNGTYSVTIPANTILQRGEYYLLSGQNTLAQNCGNVDSAVQVNLNWTTCNCTNTTIPTSGDGFMQNGGGSNEKIVLLDANLNVVDAVSRLSTPSSSINITTPALSGGCVSQTFNLSNMSISYETVSSSTGIDNSYARKVDGDCGWVKTTSISAHAPNKTGSTSSASYEFNTLTASECTGTTGSISINVSSVSVATLFPMNYTLAYDADSNNAFSSADHYSYGVDSSASSIDINSLAYGRYRITVGTSDGCNLKSFDFYIFNCYGIVLPLKILYFKYNGIKDNQFVFDYKVSEPENLEEVVLEAEDGNVYKPVTRVKGHFRSDMLVISAPVSNLETFRLRLADKFGRITYSPILKTSAQSVRNKYWPNPVNDKLSFYLDSDTTTTASYIIYNAVGIKLQQKVFVLRKGGQVISIPTDKLNNGNYYLNISPRSQNQTMYIPFIKGKL